MKVQSDKDKDNETAYVNIYDEEDMVEDDNEITAERTIPSYFLKVVFLNEMETFHKENKVFDEKQIPSMTRRVYDRLQRAFEEKHSQFIIFTRSQRITDMCNTSHQAHRC